MNSRTDKRLTARRLERSSVGRAGRKHTKTKWENGPNGCLPFGEAGSGFLFEKEVQKHKIRYELRKGGNRDRRIRPVMAPSKWFRFRGSERYCTLLDLGYFLKALQC